MADQQITAADIENYKAYIGRSMSEAGTVGANLPVQMAATLDRPHRGQELPAMWHYGLFQPSAMTNTLGIDGHPWRGECSRAPTYDFCAC